MTKQEMLSESAKVAEHFLSEGISERAMKKMSAFEFIHDFPDVAGLVEIPEKNYDEWAKHNPEEKSLNYFKSLVAFEMAYLQRKK